MTRKILYSPGYGAGWTSWESDPEVKKLMLTYPPIIKAVESGGVLTATHPAVVDMLNTIKKMGKQPPYLGGLHSLR